MSSRTVTVSLGERSYQIVISSGALESAGSILREGLGDSHSAPRAALISNARVHSLYGRVIERSFRQAGFRVSTHLIGDSERSKSLRTAETVWTFLIANRFERGDVVVALGGGVVGDLAGYAAASYLRGVRYVQIPTTLLAQIDSSVGGKTAVNHRLGKNLIGAFHQPQAVIIDPSVLGTLAQREFQAGMYEALKYGIIRDASLAESIVAFDPAHMVDLIARCCEIKADVVATDERESGLRQILNFGHTIGHALEAVTGYRRLKHGEAVGYGMKAATWMASNVGLLSQIDMKRITESVDALGRLPQINDLKAGDIVAAIQHDKKVAGGRPTFVLPLRVGAVTITSDVPATAIRDSVKRLLADRQLLG
jgi:3-dehydroquinate synthase